MSLLRLADQPAVSWARFGRYGEGGSYGYQIDASGLEVRNRFMHQDLLPATADVSLQTRIRLKSSLVANNPAFEGLAVKHRGFQLLESGEHQQVWDSAPEVQGKRAWIAATASEFTTFNFINNIPPDLGIDYCTWELEVRAQSGQVEVDNVECRYYYGKLYPMGFEGTQSRLGSASLSIETIPVESGDDVWRFLAYYQTEDVDIQIGQVIVVPVSCIANGRSLQYSAAIDAYERIPGITGLMMKFRRKGTGTYDFMDLCSGYSSVANKFIPLSETRQRRAKHHYDQVELIGFCQPEWTTTGSDSSVDRLLIQDAEVDLMIADFVAPSQ